MSQLQKCKELLADLSNQMSDMERGQNSRISSMERVCPSVGNPATTSTSPLLPSEQSDLEHQQVFGYTQRNCHNQARRQGSWNQTPSKKSRHSQTWTRTNVLQARRQRQRRQGSWNQLTSKNQDTDRHGPEQNILMFSLRGY